jgi:hypothetical protein
MENVTLPAHAGFRTLEASMRLLRRVIDILSGIGDQVSFSECVGKKSG